MILPIYMYGQPVLRKVTQDITPEYKGLGQSVQGMLEALGSSDGIGLVAPQTGKFIRVVVIGLDVLSDDSPEYKDFRCVYIGPYIIGIDENASKESMDKGCLSIPGIRGAVSRTTRIHVQYMDEDSTPHDEWIGGYLACAMQHEFNHLDGRMFVDHIPPFRKQMIKSKLRDVTQGEYGCHYCTRSVRK